MVEATPDLVPPGGAIRTQEQFNAAVALIPYPVRGDWVQVYNRLRALGVKRGFSWPYRVYVHPLHRRYVDQADGIGRRSPQGPEVARG